jgi:putative transposase
VHALLQGHGSGRKRLGVIFHTLGARDPCRRHKKAAKRFFRKLLKGLTYVPRMRIMDKLTSYGAAKREILPGVEHRQRRYLNNQCEHSHQPTCQRACRMQGCTSAGHAQRLLSAYGPIAQPFRPRRHLLAAAYRQAVRHRFERWAERTDTECAAYGGARSRETPVCLTTVSVSTTRQCPPGRPVLG